MIWYFERDADLMTCEIRHSSDGPSYEFEVTPAAGPPATQRFDSATDLVEEHLRKQSALQAQGWTPRLSNLTVVD